MNTVDSGCSSITCVSVLGFVFPFAIFCCRVALSQRIFYVICAILNMSCAYTGLHVFANIVNQGHLQTAM